MADAENPPPPPSNGAAATTVPVKPSGSLRSRLISKSISAAIFKDYTADKKTLLARVLAFFYVFHVFQLHLSRFKAAVFKHLRDEVWQYDEQEYRDSFQAPDPKGHLNPIGDLGYSGSTFFTTTNSKFLIKSLPRRFEYTFFMKDMLMPYHDHMAAHPESLLVRITDFLHTPYISLGGVLALAPSHHVIMENALYGKNEDVLKEKWETYDLKPNDYFYPERDLAGGALATESVKDRLVDKFPDMIKLPRDDRDRFLSILDADTDLLMRCNAVDYSLFVIRYPAPSPFRDDNANNREIPILKARPSPWRAGVLSSDEKWVYRAVVLDFFWAKHKMYAKAMTGLVKTFNKLAHKGPMSITADPQEYKNRFMKMVEGIVEVIERNNG